MSKSSPSRMSATRCKAEMILNQSRRQESFRYEQSLAHNAMMEKTARLRELRLAKEADDQERAASAPTSAKRRESFTIGELHENKFSMHSFMAGNVVRLRKRFPSRNAAPGPYKVVAQLPERNGQFQYRIKSACEPFYRSVAEDDLESDVEATITNRPLP